MNGELLLVNFNILLVLATDAPKNEPEFVRSATTFKIVENSTIHVPCQLTDMSE